MTASKPEPIENARSLTKARREAVLKRLNERAPITCPVCGGTEWALQHYEYQLLPGGQVQKYFPMVVLLCRKCSLLLHFQAHELVGDWDGDKE